MPAKARCARRSWPTGSAWNPEIAAGFAIGALLAGITADAFGLNVAMWVIAALTFVSGIVSATRMAETLPAEARTTVRANDESAMAMPHARQPLAVDMHRPK